LRSIRRSNSASRFSSIDTPNRLSFIPALYCAARLFTNPHPATGKGFSAEEATNLFRPFYTTKKSGHGTGLGLSISRTIIQDHQGSIEASGSPGKGATFTLRLLRLRGYAVELFSSAEAALAWPLLTEAMCLITDVKMPGMNGEQFLEEVRRRSGAPPVVMITGHGDVAMAVRCLKAGAFDFLEKPFDDDVLLASRCGCCAFWTTAWWSRWAATRAAKSTFA
jgi:CheY-like chemotaxis protein